MLSRNEMTGLMIVLFLCSLHGVHGKRRQWRRIRSPEHRAFPPCRKEAPETPAAENGRRLSVSDAVSCRRIGRRRS